MTNKRRGLGRNLDALLGGARFNTEPVAVASADTAETPPQGVSSIAIDLD